MSRTLTSTPLDDGFAMPAEFSPHAGCWMLWPERPDNWRDGAQPAQRGFAEVAAAIARFEPVTMGVSAAQFEFARGLLPLDDLETRYYLRFDVGDDPGVLGKIASALGEEGVSVEQMVQEGRAEETGAPVPILIISHRCREGAVRAAVRKVYDAPYMKRPPRFMRIEDI